MFRFIILALLTGLSTGWTIKPAQLSQCSRRRFHLHATTPDSPASSTDLAKMKSSLFALCASCDRGFGATTSQRSEVSSLLTSLSELSPTANPSYGVDDNLPDAPLRGLWRLVYTSALDVLSLGASPISTVGAIYQDARELPTIMNVIDQQPRVQSLFPSNFPQTVLRSEVTTRASIRTDTRVGLEFKALGVAPVEVLGLDAKFVPPLKLNFPKLPDSFQEAGYFEILYLDEDLLVIEQGQGGSAAGVFAATRVDDIS